MMAENQDAEEVVEVRQLVPFMVMARCSLDGTLHNWDDNVIIECREPGQFVIFSEQFISASATLQRLFEGRVYYKERIMYTYVPYVCKRIRHIQTPVAMDHLLQVSKWLRLRAEFDLEDPDTRVCPDEQFVSEIGDPLDDWLPLMQAVQYLKIPKMFKVLCKHFGRRFIENKWEEEIRNHLKLEDDIADVEDVNLQEMFWVVTGNEKDPMFEKKFRKYDDFGLDFLYMSRSIDGGSFFT